jgi:hypothetical protein
MKAINIGGQSFQSIIENNNLYIDKTLFIKDWWTNSDSVTLITRPRRFGKTLMMDMLKEFFSIDNKDSHLFNSLNVSKYSETMKLQGTYPVISISFASVKGIDYENTIELMKQIIINLYNKHIYLIKENFLEELEQQQFNKMNYDMNESQMIQSIHQLSIYLERYYHQKVIILLDEYDTPIVEAYNNGYYKEMINFMRPFFNATFKDNTSMYRSVLTGITRVSKESMFSDFNNIVIDSMKGYRYSEYFGFTQEEVDELLEEYDLIDTKEDVKYWYDGFTVGNMKDIYNPWSILNYLDIKEFEPYWINTSGNSLVNTLIKTGSSTIKENFERLLSHTTIESYIDEYIAFDELEDNDENIYSLLVSSGYLKIVDCKDDLYTLDITNYEVRTMFERMVRRWFQSNKVIYNDFIKALLNHDEKNMNKFLNKVMKETFSSFDTSQDSRYPEKFYHGFTLGLLLDLRKQNYISSNKESGYGRYDIMIEPLDNNKPGYILEFKVVDKDDNETMEEVCDNALKQIEEKKYETELKAKGIKTIYKYALAFEGKRVLIKAG